MTVNKVSQASRPDGKSENWYAIWVCPMSGIKNRLPLYTSLKASQSAAGKIQQLIDLKAANATLPHELSRWVESLPAKMLNRLAKCGVVDGRTVAASKPLAEHLADWKASLLAKGNLARDVEQKARRVLSSFSGSGFAFWSDVSGSKLQGHLAKLRESTTAEDGRVKQGISAQTFNHRLQACKQFCNWMVREGRAIQSPLSHLQGLNVRAERRHDRRALTVDEMRWLLNVTENGWSKAGDDGKPVVIVSAAERFGMSGKERALLYRLAVESKFRRGELASLTPASFDLSGDHPSVTVKAAYAKARKERRIQLASGIAAELKRFMEGRLPTAPLFRMPSHQHSAKMVKADLDAARQAWIADANTPEDRAEREQSCFLTYQDANGQYADFHSFRHTGAVWLFQHNNAHPREVQELLGVSCLSLVDRYSKSFTLSDMSVVERGPDLSPLSPLLPPVGAKAQTAADTSGLKKLPIR